MRTALLAATLAVIMAPGASANDFPVLSQGDVLDTAGYGNLSVTETRKILREVGYSALTFGEHFGQTIKLSGVAPDHQLYRLKIRSTSGEVLSAYRIRYPY